MTIEDTGTAPMDSGATEDLRLDSAPVVEAQAPADDTVSSPDAAIDADLQGIWDKLHPPRSADGKFESKTPSEPVESEAPESTEGQPPEPEAVEQAKPAIDAPISWPKEMKERWATLPPEAQEYLAKRESETHAKITQMGQETATYRPVANVIEQHKDLFAKYQVPPDRGIGMLLEAQRKLDSNPAAAISELARGYGVDLAQLVGVQGEQAPQQVAALQHELNSLKQQLNETVAESRARKEAEAQAIQTKNLSTIDSFLNGKDLAEGDYEQLAVLIEAERRLSPGATPDKLLEAAYETFQMRNPEKREALIAERTAQAEAKRKAEADKKAAEAKKLGSLNVKSSPGSSSSSRSMDDTLMEIARKHYK